MAQDLGIGRIMTTAQERGTAQVTLLSALALVELDPGDRVCVEGGGASLAIRDGDSIGVVDPFLIKRVRRGQRFWVFVQPGTSMVEHGQPDRRDTVDGLLEQAIHLGVLTPNEARRYRDRREASLYRDPSTNADVGANGGYQVPLTFSDLLRAEGTISRLVSRQVERDLAEAFIRGSGGAEPTGLFEPPQVIPGERSDFAWSRNAVETTVEGSPWRTFASGGAVTQRMPVVADALHEAVVPPTAEALELVRRHLGDEALMEASSHVQGEVEQAFRIPSQLITGGSIVPGARIGSTMLVGRSPDEDEGPSSGGS